MNVASLALCRELHDLSGWSGTLLSWYCDEQRDDTPVVNLSEPLKVVGGVGYYDHQYPAYDLSYLLRKMPPRIGDDHFLEMGLNTGTERVTMLVWMFHYVASEDQALVTGTAETPEDAAARLAISLFRRSLLSK